MVGVGNTSKSLGKLTYLKLGMESNCTLKWKKAHSHPAGTCIAHSCNINNLKQIKKEPAEFFSVQIEFNIQIIFGKLEEKNRNN